MASATNSTRQEENLKTKSEERPEYSEEHLKLLHQQGGRYFTFREDFLKIVSIEGAVLLQKLLTFSCWKHDKLGKNYTGWFLYTTKLCEKQLGLSSRQQKRVFRELVDNLLSLLNT